MQNGNFKTLITTLLVISILVGLYANYLVIKEHKAKA